MWVHTFFSSKKWKIWTLQWFSITIWNCLTQKSKTTSSATYFSKSDFILMQSWETTPDVGHARWVGNWDVDLRLKTNYKNDHIFKVWRSDCQENNYLSVTKDALDLIHFQFYRWWDENNYCNGKVILTHFTLVENTTSKSSIRVPFTSNCNLWSFWIQKNGL